MTNLLLDAKLKKREIAVSVAARQLFAKLFGLSEANETEVCRLPLRTRKRIGASLYAEEVAAQLFYGALREETVFRTRVLVPLLLPDQNVTRARLRYATWRLVVRHREAILELALDLSPPPHSSRRMTDLEMYRIVPRTESGLVWNWQSVGLRWQRSRLITSTGTRNSVSGRRKEQVKQLEQ